MTTTEEHHMATIRFNDSKALYECVTEYATYEQVHVSGDYGLFQEETNERFNCVVYANGEARHVNDGDEHEIDGVTYHATINGWVGPMQFNLVSTCDDAGQMLAARIENPDFVRVIESHATRDQAESAKAEWLKWYAERGVQVGDGCLSVIEVS